MTRTVLVVICLWCCLVPPTFASDDTLSTALARAAAEGHTAAVAEMIAKGAAVDARDAQGRTALMMAAGAGHFETVRLLMIKGATKALKNAQGQSALDLATARQHVDIVALLQDGS